MDKPIAKPSIREGNERAILAAAESVFAERGFGGATMAAIAARAGVPKPNVHYYFPTKETLYRAVIEQVLTAWLDAAHSFDTSDDPRRGADRLYRGQDGPRARNAAEFADLGERDHARRARHPGFSRHDADPMGALARARSCANGSRAGKLRPIEPKFLFYMIWATTQHYANAAHEIASLEKRPAAGRRRRSSAPSGRWWRRFWAG